MKSLMCAQVRPELKSFADGELSPLARWRVARHLRSCPDCQKELIQMQTLSEELKPAETEAEPALEPELRAKILASAPVVASPELLRRRRRVARKKTVLALGAASLAGGLLWVGAQNGAGFGPSPLSDSSSTSTATGTHNPNAVVGVGQAEAPSASAGSATSATTSDEVSAVPPSSVSQARRGNLDASNFLTADGHVKSLAPRARREVIDSIKTSRAQAQAVAPPSPSISSDYAAGAASVVPATRAVHREGSVSVAVNDAEQSSDGVQTFVKNAGGFVATTALETDSSGRRTATLDCRVPADKFEAVVAKIGQLGTVRAKSLSGQDITAQLAQSGARRQTLQEELSIAQAKLSEKEKNAKKRDAGQIYILRSDVRQVRMQAAQARAQLETLRKYGDTSSLYVSLQDRSPLKPAGAGLSDSLGLSGNATWNAFLQNARVPFQLLLLVLAYVPIWLPALLLWRKFGRKWLAE